MTKTEDTFGIRVKQLRERLSLTQEALAESLGVSFAKNTKSNRSPSQGDSKNRTDEVTPRQS